MKWVWLAAREKSNVMKMGWVLSGEEHGVNNRSEQMP